MIGIFPIQNLTFDLNLPGNGVHLQRYRDKNIRIIRCLGRTSATDVLAVIQTPLQFYVSNTSTIRASLGDHLRVPITKTKDLPDEVFIRRLPDGWVYKAGTTADVSLPLTFDPVTLGDVGIYILGNDGTSQESKTFSAAKVEIEYNGAYFHLIVRECESDRYGPQCQSWCPDCQNGGICHAVTGTCVCAPGYSGPTCQHACPRGSFGSSCQFICQKTTLGFSPATKGQCEKLIICLPEPYGCSCAPGYTGPFCDQECPAGRYGAGCSHDCDYCENKHCDSVNGSCTRGCKNEVFCRGAMPLDLPRLRTPPSLTDIRDTSLVVNFSTWTREEDDGSEAVGIVSYLLQYRREDDLTWTTVKTVSHSSVSGQTQVTVEHLSPGYQYTLRVLVNTSRGAADGSTNKRVHHVTFVTHCSAPRLDDLQVSNITDQSAVVTWNDTAGNHERCATQYEVVLTPTTAPVSTTLKTTGQSLLLSDLAPDTPYNVTITASHNGTSVMNTSAFRTLYKERERCHNFTSISDSVGYHYCSEFCLAAAKVPAETNEQLPVFGTVYYHKESDVCLAALHAGAVSTRGGPVTFTRDNTAHNIRGTIQHRVVSLSKLQENSADHTTYKFLNITPVVTQQDLAEDVIIVHNSYSGNSGQLDLTCLASDTSRRLTEEDIVSWRYTKHHFDLKIFQERFTEKSGKCVFPYNYEGKEYWECTETGSNKMWCGTDPIKEPTSTSYWDYCTINRGRWAIYQKSPRKDNVRAVRCLGRSSATDVLAVVQVPDQLYVSVTSTIRASLGDHLSVPITKSKGLPFGVFIRRLPDEWVYEAWATANVSLPLTFDPVTLGDAGIYILGNGGTIDALWYRIASKIFKNAKSNVENNGAYLHLIVRECESDRYGPQCQSWCPDCQNGGICHAVTGSCVCAPGYSGPTCQHVCSRGSFGSSCQFTCQEATLGFSPATEGQCEKLTICLPEPYGCSCAPGYTGPFCDKECPAGRYGAGCSHDCDYCKNNHCDSVSGSCTLGCINEAHCRGGMPLDLPRLRTPPSLTDITNTSVVVNFSTWTREEDDGSEEFGIVSYLLQYRREDDLTWTTLKTVSHSSVSGQTKDILNLTVEHLSPGYQYTLRVLVNTSRGAADGSTNKRVHHVTFVTHCSDPSVGVKKFSCKQTNYVTTTCTADLTGCDTYNGPDIHFNVSLETYLQCSNKTLEFYKLSNISGGKYVAEFMNLPAGMTFVATLSITNNVSRRVLVKTTVNFTTAEEKPPEVRNFTANILSSNKVRLLWNDPCPSNGVITGFIYKEISQDNWTPIGTIDTTPCSAGYDRCVDVDGLRANTNYAFWVSAINSAGRGMRQEVWIVTMEIKPGPPQQLDVVPHDNSLDLQLMQPHLCGGILHNFTIQLKNKTNHVDNCTKDAPDPTCSKDAKTIPAERLTCQMPELKPGRRYKAEAFFCNAAGCGEPFVKTVATLPIPPKLSGKFRVKTKTNTTVTLALPTLTMEGDGDRSVAILVSRLSEDAQDVAENFTATYIKLVAEGISQNRSASGGERVRRQAGDRHCEDTNRTYIAAVLTQAAEEFMVGEMTSGGPYPNCALKPAQPYMMAVVARVQLEERSAYAEMKLDELVVPEWDCFVLSIVSSVFGLLLLILIITIIIIFIRHKMLNRKSGAKYCKDTHRTEVYDNGRAAQDLSSHNILALLDIPTTSQDTSPPPAVDKENVSEHIYESNSQEDIYCNMSQRVAFDNVEAYLNKSIGAHDTSEDCMSVPSNVGKSMSVGEHPENKRKNRCQNNLPYDETRVELSVINNDPFSNYINANHVYGFGGVLKYIASQGPKEANVSTLGDFWRMICEHHIFVIIMVANFEESGKENVGKYLDFGGALMIGDYKVEVVKTDHHPNYNVSLVQVWKNGIAHTLTHYHYLSWPDHGVPTEAHSLATMLRQVILTHTDVGVVVHCSTGMGRTGTVLLVLLLHEMLMVQGSVDPLEVLERLWDCRARLVENTAQYNLGLQIFDELLYGDNTVIPTVSAHDQMKEFMRTSHELYQKALALPSGLTFKVASQAEYYQLNRNLAVVPADTRRIFLKMEGDEMLSQYINAVRLDGLDEPDTMIVTEHPLPSTLNKFWKLVVEKKCPSIIFINTFDGYEKEFPCVLPGPDCDLQAGRYTVHTLHVTPYKSFDLYSIEVFSQQNIHQTVSVYQLTSWPYRTQVPPSPHVLVEVSEMLLQSPRSPEAGPLLLSCGDGVTGCGLLAGALLTIENIQKSNKIDVYRTVVKLRRARPQFFVSQDQFELLYSAAVVYLENYDTYVNFPV
ncbi:uncharacterized protein [Procambarus clarkii]|uniref:uncharacterized protein n=1 Tax=Procambarus clarkii TaxID=6728 RepID=UPI0037449189